MVWVRDVIWWQVDPFALHCLGEPDSNGAPRLAQLEGCLDHVVQLGCTGVTLTGVLASRAFGRDITDHFRVDPRLGDLDDLDHFVLEAKSRGLRIAFNSGFHYVAGDFVESSEPRKGAKAPETTWLRTGITNGAAPRPGGKYALPLNDGVLAVLDHGSKAVAAHVVDTVKFWLSRGVDAWVFDDAYAMPPEFWRKVLPKVGRKHGKVWSVAELVYGDYAAYVQDGGLRSATQYELFGAIREGLANTDLSMLAMALQRNNTYVEHFAPHVFLGTPRTTRIADALGSVERAVLAAAIQLTLPGIPSVLAGDEFGFRSSDLDTTSLKDRAAALVHTEDPTYSAYHTLLALRHAYPWLFRCRVEVNEVAPHRIVYTCVPFKGKAAGKADGERLTVEVAVLPSPTARITDVDGAVRFTHGKPASL